MIFTQSTHRFRIVVGLDGGVYVCRERFYGGRVWQIVGSEDQ